MRSQVSWIAPFFLTAVLAGCGGENRLYDTPKSLPPGHRPPQPPALPVSPKDVNKLMKTGKTKDLLKKLAEPKAESPPPSPPSP